MISFNPWTSNQRFFFIQCILLFQFFSLQAISQKRLDTLGLQATYPFDEEFILKFPIKKNDSILHAYIYELRHGCIKNSIGLKCKKKDLAGLFPGSAKALRDSAVKNRTRPAFGIDSVLKDLGLTETIYFAPLKFNNIITRVKKFAPSIPSTAKTKFDSLVIILEKLNTKLLATPSPYPEELHDEATSLAEKILQIFRESAVGTGKGSAAQFESIVDDLIHKKFIYSFSSSNKIKFDSILKKQEYDTLPALVTYIKDLEDFIDDLVYEKKSPIKLPNPGQDSSNAYIKLSSLEPEKEYFLIMTGRVVLEGLDLIAEAIVNGDTAKARELYEKAAKQQNKKLSTNPSGECKDCGYLDFQVQPFDDFLIYFATQHISKMYLEIVEMKTKLSEASLALKRVRPVEITPPQFKEIIARSKECERCKDSLYYYQWFDNAAQNLVSSITHFSRLADTTFSYGYATLDFMGPIIPAKVSIQQRSDNLKKTIEVVDLVASLLDNYQNEQSVNEYVILRQQLVSMRDSLLFNYFSLVSFEESKKNIEGRLAKAKEKLSDIFLKYPGFTMPVSAFATSTYTWGFEGRTGFAVKADFGFLGYGDFWNDKDFFGVRPFVGFHVNFRPLNTEVPWNKIKGWKKYFSFTGGALVGTIKEDGKRDGLIGNVSIFTGLGYALGHGLRVTPGVVWYNRLSPNPLITSKRIGATPYLGLSMDFRIQDVYKSFVNLF